MNDEATSQTAEGAPETTSPEPPSGFREYVRWRETGALPPKEAETPPAAAGAPLVDQAAPQAKTEPQSGADDTQESEDEGDKRPNGRVRKIDKLTRELEQLKAQLASVQVKSIHAQPPEPEKPAEPAGKPRLHDYPTLEAYQEALTDWKMDQREAARQADAQKREAERAVAKLQTDWQNSEQAARTAHPDYDEIVQSVRAPEGPGVPAMRQALLEDEAGAEILYYLGNHPDELKRIAALPLASAAREVGRIAAKLAPPDSGKPKPQHVSSAPRPPAPLSRPSAGSSKKNILDEDFARTDFRGWEKERVAQLKGQ